MTSMSATIDPDDLYGDAVVAILEIKVRRNGSMSVAGSINDESYAIAMLDAAKDSVRSYNKRHREALIIPAKDLDFQK